MARPHADVHSRGRLRLASVRVATVKTHPLCAVQRTHHAASAALRELPRTCPAALSGGGRRPILAAGDAAHQLMPAFPPQLRASSRQGLVDLISRDGLVLARKVVFLGQEKHAVALLHQERSVSLQPHSLPGVALHAHRADDRTLRSRMGTQGQFQ